MFNVHHLPFMLHYNASEGRNFVCSFLLYLTCLEHTQHTGEIQYIFVEERQKGREEERKEW